MMDVLSPEGMQQLVKEVKALGVPSGGTTDQILAKASADNYDTHWVDPPAGEAVEQAEYLVKAPIGTIVIWSGDESNIPSGWVLCNGQNGTPDLRDRFVLGAGNQYSVGSKAGDRFVTLTVDQMPRHTHGVRYPSSSGGLLLNGTNLTSSSVASVANNTKGSNINTESAGSSQPHNNMPPYYALCYIMKISPDPAVDGVTQAELTTALATKQDAFEVGSTLELTANARTAGGRLEVKTPVQSVLTQAEYDALSEEKKNKGLYVISDGTSGNGGGGDSSEEIYSTEETRIGTWIDGKPLYRRTYTLNITTNGVGTTTLLDVSDLHIDTMMDLYGGFTALTFNSGLFDQPINGTYAIGLSEDKTNLLAYTSSSNQNRINFLILEYTKTTDTGGAK